MKLTKELRAKINKWFDNITSEELYNILKEYRMKVITREYLETHQVYPMDLGIALNHVEDPKESYENIKKFYEDTIEDEEKRKEYLDEVLEYYAK